MPDNNVFNAEFSLTGIQKRYFSVSSRRSRICDIKIESAGTVEYYRIFLSHFYSLFWIRSAGPGALVSFRTDAPIKVNLVPNQKKRPLHMKIAELCDDFLRRHDLFRSEIRTETGIQIREISLGRMMPVAKSDAETQLFQCNRLLSPQVGNAAHDEIFANVLSNDIVGDLVSRLGEDDGRDYILLADQKRFSVHSQPALAHFIAEQFGDPVQQEGPAWEFMRANPAIGLIYWGANRPQRQRSLDRELRRLAALIDIQPSDLLDEFRLPAICFIRKAALAAISDLDLKEAQLDQGRISRTALGNLIPASVLKAGFGITALPESQKTARRGKPVDGAEWAEFRSPANLSGRQVCLFVGLLGDDRGFSKHALQYMAALKAQDFYVVALGVSLGSAFDSTDPGPNFCDAFASRANDGHDFALWAAAIRRFPEVWSAEALLLANDSILPLQTSLADLIQKVRGSQFDVTGLTQSTLGERHLQSYFVYFSKDALSSSATKRFWNGVRSWKDKSRIISLYEIGMTSTLQSAGLQCGSIFDIKGQDAKRLENPTLYGWKALIEAGFPFIKSHVLKDGERTGEIESIKQFLSERGLAIE